MTRIKQRKGGKLVQILPLHPQSNRKVDTTQTPWFQGVCVIFVSFFSFVFKDFFSLIFHFLPRGSKPDPHRPTKITKKYAYILLKMTGCILAYSSLYILWKFGLFELYFSDFRFLSSEVYFEIFHNISLKLCLFYYLNTTW